MHQAHCFSIDIKVKCSVQSALHNTSRNLLGFKPVEALNYYTIV